MGKNLRVLNIEDSERDTALLARHITAAGYDLTIDRVETSDEMIAALEASEWDIIICDYSMPRFNALLALDLLRGTGTDIPFIIISGTVGEDVAVQAMLTGAHDYIQKGNLTRLVPAIERELHQARNRREQRQIKTERQAIYEIIQGAISSPNLDEYLKFVHRSVSRILDAENFIVMLHDRATDVFEYKFWADKFDTQPPPRPIGHGFGSYVLKTGRPLLLTKELKKDLVDRGEAVLNGTPSRSWIGAPLRTPTRIIGVVVVQHYEIENAYSQRDLEFLSSVADQIALAVERKRVEVAITESEGRYRDLIENAIDIIYTADLTGMITSTNSAGRNVTGYTNEEAMALNMSELLAPEYVEIAKERMARTFAGEKVPVYEVEIIAKDGHRIPLEINARIIYENGVITGLQGIARDITERKAAEAALEESEASFKSLFDTANDAILVMNEGIFLACNPAAETLYGCKKGDLIGSSPNKFSPLEQPDGRLSEEKARSLIRAAMTGTPQNFEWKHSRLDGTLFDAEVSLNRVDFGGKAQIQGTVRDISARKLTEAAIQEKTAFLEAQVNSTIDGILVVDGDGNQILQNQRLADFFGIPKEIADDPDDSKQLEWVITTIKNPKQFAEKVAYLYSHPDEISRDEILLKDGTILDRYSAPVIGKDRKNYGRIWSFRDTTEQRRTNQELVESNEKFEQLADNITDAFWVRSLDMREVYYVSPAFETIWGRSVASLYADPHKWADFIFPDDQARVQAAFKVLTRDSTDLDIEYRILRPEGEIRWIRLRGFPVKDDAGAVIRYAGIVTDVTDRNQIDESLRESEERYRTLFEMSPDGVVMFDLEMTVLVANDRSADIFGYGTADELIGKTAFDFIAPEYHDRIRTSVGDVFEAGHLAPVESMGIKAEGSEFAIELSATLIRDSAGQPKAILGVVRDITLRKQAEIALTESREQLAIAAASVNLGIWDWDVIANRIEWDDRMYELYGIREEEFGGAYDAWQSGLHPDDRKQADSNIQAALEGERPYNNEFRVVWPTGEVHYIEARALVQRAVDGTPTRMVGVNWDICERKLIETDLHELTERTDRRERMLTTLLSSMTDFAQIFDREGRLLFVNKPLLDLWGLTLADVVGKTFRDLEYPPYLAEKMLAQIEQVYSTAMPVMDESPFTGVDGSPGFYEYIFSPAIGPDGDVDFVVGSTRDVTERNRADVMLRSSEATLAKSQEIAHLGSWELDIAETEDMDQGSLHWSDEVFRIFGYEPREIEVSNESFFNAVHPEDRKSVKTAMTEALENGSQYRIDHRIIRPDASVRFVREHSEIVRNERGEIVKMVGTIQDITRESQLSEQLRQSQKMEAVGVLAGGIAHDFNNLLTAINGYSALTLKKMREDDPLRNNIKEVKRAGDRAADLTGQLLAFGRKQVLNPVVLSLNTVIFDIEKMLRRVITESIDLRVISDPDLGNVKADSGQIEQVILNLSVNARDAMPDGGTLTLETHNVYLDENYVYQHNNVSPGHFVRLTLSDTGEGMDARTKAHIFEPFYTTKEVGKGTGLGLSIVYGIVKQSGGDILVYSELGHGTTFKIYLPCVDETVQKPEWIGDRAELYLGTETILLVEDEDVVRTLVREILTENGYKILEAADGEEALAICETYAEHIDLLLTDVIMPKMGGAALKDLVTKMRPDISVLFMSGYTDDAVAHRGNNDGKMAFIEKPFTPDGLARKVHEVLEFRNTRKPLPADPVTELIR